MASTLAALQATVSGALSGTSFSLTIANLASPDCDTIAAGYVNAGILALTNATVTPTATGSTVTGTGVNYPFNSITGITVLFYLDNSSNAQFNITANPAAGINNWSLATGFPALANSSLATLFFTVPPILTLSTDPAIQSPPLGMAFTGIANLSGYSSGLSAIFNIQTCTITGPIVLAQNASKIKLIDLKGTIPETVNLLITELTNLAIQVSFTKGLDTVTGQYLAKPFIRFSGDISFTANNTTYAIRVSMEVGSPGGPYTLRAEISGLIQATLTELGVLLADTNIANSLPSDFQLDSVIQLTDVFIVLDSSAVNFVASVGVEIKNRSPWTMLTISDSGKSLVADNVSLAFTLTDPFNTKQIVVSFASNIAFDTAGSMDIMAIAGSGWVVQGAIPEDQTLSLSELVKTFLGAPSGVPNMELYDLNFQLSASNYQLSLYAELFWWLDPLPISIDNVNLVLAYDVTSGTTASVNGSFSIAGVQLFIAADYPGEDGAWIFSGGTLPGSSIPVGTLLGNLASIFSVDQSLPTFLSSFVISELGITFNTATYDFTFHCTGNFIISGTTPVVITVDIQVQQQSDKTYRKTFAGKMVLDGKEFDLIFSTDPSKTTFIAEYYNLDGTSINIQSFISKVTSNQTLLNLIPPSLAFSIKDALFAWNSASGTSDFLFAMDWGMGVSLSNLPIVGQYFGPDETLDLAFQVTFASDAGFTTTVINDLNTLIPPNTITFPPQDIPAGTNINTQVRLGGTTTNIALPVTVATGEITTTGDGTWGNNPQPQWFNIQKTFGPVYFNRVGVLYNTTDSQLYFYLDASFNSGGLNITLDGLSLSAPITEFWNVSFGLNGMGIDYKNGALQIGGAFLHSQKTVDKIVYDEYAGTAVVQLENFGLAALGAYADYNGSPSMFVYGQLSVPLGGPPFFLVTGLAAGFGYNRTLTVPTLDTMLDFPLVQTALQLSNGESGSTFTGMLQSLGKWIPPQIGEYWLAAGITFTSFNIIDSFVLLTVAFGQKFQLNVFGLSTMIAPPEAGNVSALAEIQLAIIATLDWDSGYLGVTGQLTKNSFLFSRNAKLTGGFAMCTWFSGEHAGDFVVTVGGYHPLFKVPAYYPKVPRLGFNWQVNSNMLIKGEMYFALTPSAIMAGGLLQATWTSGNFRAWFSAHADFIIAWKPYYYNASMAVTIGASYTFDILGYQKTISADVGAALSIWGPDFSGTALVDLGIISFTVAFGAAKKTGPVPIAYSEFNSSFLPENPVSITATAGIIGQTTDNDVIINPATFALNIDSAIPLQLISSGGTTLVGGTPNSLLGIAPMGAASSAVTIALTATITPPSGSSSLTQLFTFTSASKNFPAALWGTALQPKVNSATFISNVLSGFTLTAIPVTPGYQFAIAQSVLALELFLAPNNFSFAAAETDSFTTDQGNRDTINATIINSIVVSQRDLLLASMNIDAAITDNLTASIGNMFINAPVIIKD